MDGWMDWWIDGLMDLFVFTDKKDGLIDRSFRLYWLSAKGWMNEWIDELIDGLIDGIIINIL